MKSLEELKSLYSNYDDLVNDLFGTDDLLKSFGNVKDHYLNDNISKLIYDYKFYEAEMIMGDIYKSDFEIDDNISMSEIKEQGPEYFRQKLLKKYDAET